MFYGDEGIETSEPFPRNQRWIDWVNKNEARGSAERVVCELLIKVIYVPEIGIKDLKVLRK
jgi:hypothetical protein